MGYEKKISELTLNLQKAERDSAFKDEELRNVRQYAKEAAEKYHEKALKHQVLSMRLASVERRTRRRY